MPPDDMGRALKSHDAKSDDWGQSSDAYSLDFSSSSICERDSSIASAKYDKSSDEVTQLENQVVE